MFLPSYLVDSDYSGGALGSFGEVALRVGEVVEALPPGSPQNRYELTKNQWVYLVNVAYREGNSAFSVVPFRCTVMDSFGSLADHFRHTVRPATNQTSAMFGNGAQVLVLCVNGDKTNAYIIGGTRHRDDKNFDPTAIFMDFLFNGVHASIDKDGALTVQVPGATNPDGSPAARDSSNHGSSVTFGKDGTITIDDHNGQQVIVNPSTKKVEVHGSHVTVFSSDIELGDTNLNEVDNGVVVADGIDYFTGLTYYELENTSKKVMAKR